MWVNKGCVTLHIRSEAVASHLAGLQPLLAAGFICFSFFICFAWGVPRFFWLSLFPNKTSSVTSFSPHLHKHLGWHNAGNGAEAKHTA